MEPEATHVWNVDRTRVLRWGHWTTGALVAIDHCSRAAMAVVAVLSRKSFVFRSAVAALIVVSSALADTLALGAVEDERECRVGIGPMGLLLIATVARLLCWVRHGDWAHSTGYGPT
jgi:hypothetical protein